MYYIASGFDWVAGDIISNATFKRSPHKSFFVEPPPLEFANIKDYLARRKTELSLEDYRAKTCPHLPSRKDAIFLNAKLEDAERWCRRGCRSGYKIYELSVLEEQNSCKANYIWYNYCVRLLKNPKTEFKKLFGDTPEIDFHMSLQFYWENSPTEDFECPSELEILYLGTLVVVQKIAEPEVLEEMETN